VDIFSAVERKNLRELRRILKKDPAAARDSDCWGRTALMLACVEGEPGFVELLLPWSDANASDRDGETALMLASFGHAACVELLLPASDPMARDADGWTALMWAASSGSERCIALLLPNSDATMATESGLTALDIARTYDQQASAQQIRRHMLDEEAPRVAGAVTQSEKPDPRSSPGEGQTCPPVSNNQPRRTRRRLAPRAASPSAIRDSTPGTGTMFTCPSMTSFWQVSPQCMAIDV